DVPEPEREGTAHDRNHDPETIGEASHHDAAEAEGDHRHGVGERRGGAGHAEFRLNRGQGHYHGPHSDIADGRQHQRGAEPGPGVRGLHGTPDIGGGGRGHDGRDPVSMRARRLYSANSGWRGPATQVAIFTPRRISRYSGSGKARIVTVRTLPEAPSESARAAMVSSSGSVRTATVS